MNSMKWMLTVLGFVLAASLSLAQQAKQPMPAGERFEQAERMVRQADMTRDMGEEPAALELYRQGFEEYTRLEREFPQWQPAMARARIAYCRDAMLSLLRRIPDSELLQAQPASPPKPDATAVCVRAAARLKAGDAEGAGALLMDALRSDPDHFSVRLLLGMARCQAGRYSDAFFLLDTLASEHPERIEARLALAAALIGRGDIERAREEVEAALALQPEASEPHFNMARVLMLAESPDRERARFHYDRSLRFGGARDAAFEATLAKEPERKAARGGWLGRFGFGRARRTPVERPGSDQQPAPEPPPPAAPAVDGPAATPVAPPVAAPAPLPADWPPAPVVRSPVPVVIGAYGAPERLEPSDPPRR